MSFETVNLTEFIQGKMNILCRYIKCWVMIFLNYGQNDWSSLLQLHHSPRVRGPLGSC